MASWIGSKFTAMAQKTSRCRSLDQHRQGSSRVSGIAELAGRHPSPIRILILSRREEREAIPLLFATSSALNSKSLQSFSVLRRKLLSEAFPPLQDPAWPLRPRSHPAAAYRWDPPGCPSPNRWMDPFRPSSMRPPMHTIVRSEPI